MAGEQLKCVLQLSLGEIAARRVAVLIWSGLDVLAEIAKWKWCPDYHFGAKYELEDIVINVKNRVNALKLPESVTKQIKDVVQPIGVKIARWEQYDDDGFTFSPKDTLSVFSKLRWTTTGKIDDRKTAEALVRCNSLSVVLRYEIACQNCLEDYIRLLWEELPERNKEYFLISKALALEFCWPHILSGELSNLDHLWRTSDKNLSSFNQCAFEYTANKGYKAASEYFFEKLTLEEREASLMRTALAVKWKVHEDYMFEKLLDTFCYLISLMSPEQQMKVLNSRPVDVFVCFLHWPRQTLFLHNARIVLNILPPTRHGELLCEMAKKLASSGHRFPKLFQEFFRECPLLCKRSVMDGYYFPAYGFLSVFFKFNDSDSTKVLFRNVDAEDRFKIVFHGDVLNLLHRGILDGKWAVVKSCFQEAGLSTEDRKRLKGYIRMSSGLTLEFMDERLKRFFLSLDEADGISAKEKKAVKRKLRNCAQEQ